MHRKLLITLFCTLLLLHNSYPQSVSERLKLAVKKLEADSQMKHAILSLYVVDAATGGLVFDKNAAVGLAPASCQKLFTSAAALDILGPGYRYVTTLGYDGKPENGVLEGNLCITGSGDPTLGSWRYDSTRDTLILERWMQAIERAGIKRVEGEIIADEGRFETQPIPGGWIWEDIGNYYGAGSWQLNWHENQYDLLLQPGNTTGDAVRILGTRPPIDLDNWVNELKTATPGSGDNACIYLPPYSYKAFVRGTIPLQKETFVISGSLPSPPRYVTQLLKRQMEKNGIILQEKKGTTLQHREGGNTLRSDNKQVMPAGAHSRVIIDSFLSPRLDSIIYWFLIKSINLYGESLIRTIGYEESGTGSTEKGVEIVRDFWARQGIDKSAIHIQDGSGLSPQNRVTTGSLVKVLQYARTRPWWPAFQRALPEINNMRMKSGAISGARSYAGYQQSKNGKGYFFGVIVNNYDGSPSLLVKKIFTLLNILK